MPNVPAKDDEEWIPAFEAAALIARRFGGLREAKEALAVGLREKQLSAVASACLVWEGEETVEPEEYEATEDQWIEVAGELFSLSEAWDSDRLGWDWDDGLFDIFAEDSTYAFMDVHFLKSELEAIDPQQPLYSSIAQTARLPTEPLQILRSLRTGAARKWDWEPALAELIARADQDGMEAVLKTSFKRGFQAKLEGWFLEWFIQKFDESPSLDQRRIRARLIVDAMERARTAVQAAVE